MPLNTFKAQIQLVDLPEFCGPGELATILVEMNDNPRFKNDNRCRPISNEGIRRPATPDEGETGVKPGQRRGGFRKRAMNGFLV